jgi:hypothetical protein
VQTFSDDDGAVIHANPVDSLDWPDFVAGLARRGSAQ